MPFTNKIITVNYKYHAIKIKLRIINVYKNCNQLSFINTFFSFFTNYNFLSLYFNACKSFDHAKWVFLCKV